MKRITSDEEPLQRNVESSDNKKEMWIQPPLHFSLIADSVFSLVAVSVFFPVADSVSFQVGSIRFHLTSFDTLIL